MIDLPPLIGFEKPAIIRSVQSWREMAIDGMRRDGFSERKISHVMRTFNEGNVDLDFVLAMPLHLGFRGSVLFAAPGSITINTTGAWSELVPRYRTSLTLRLDGAGGGGGRRTSADGTNDGTNGGNTTCTQSSMTAGGGQGGEAYTTAELEDNGNPTGPGGVAAGGTTNTNGGGGSSASSSSGTPSGGTAAASGPGNGGAGLINISGGRVAGGGGGAMTSKAFAIGSLTPASTLSGTVGAGGTRPGGAAPGGNGRVTITWT